MKEIFKQVVQGKPHVHIGKAGITEALLDQIKSQFKNRKIIKIKFLSLDEYDNMKDATKDIAKKINAKVLDIRGKTCVIQDLSKAKND